MNYNLLFNKGRIKLYFMGEWGGVVPILLGKKRRKGVFPDQFHYLNESKKVWFLKGWRIGLFKSADILKLMKLNVGRFLKGDNNKTANSGLYDIFIQKQINIIFFDFLKFEFNETMKWKLLIKNSKIRHINRN